MFGVYKNVLEKYHKRIIELLKLPEAEYGEKQINEFADLIETSHQEIDNSIERLIEIQEAFTKRHGFKIED